MSQQLHRRLGLDQVKAVLEGYRAKEIGLAQAFATLAVERAQFFRIFRRYRKDPAAFSLAYQRRGRCRQISQAAEDGIIAELKKEKQLIENKAMPVTTYNYTAVRDALRDAHCTVSVPTIIRRAKEHGYHLAPRPRALHMREVLTNFIGELIQHDSSHHQWSPYMAEKLYLITSLDDYSRRILYADFFLKETSWTHIVALQSTVLQFGAPLKYYVDQHSIFRYVKDRDQKRIWKNYTKFTDDVDPQWKRAVKACGSDVVYALSPQAKGKIERPYRWLQDRIVRTAAKEKLTTLEELRAVLKNLVETYNTRWVHSTTKEVPIVRFENALNAQRCLFRPLKIVRPGQEVKDIFCLSVWRIADGYGKVSLDGLGLAVPGGTPRQSVDLKLVPDMDRRLVEIRFWQQDKFLGTQHVPMSDLQIVSF